MENNRKKKIMIGFFIFLGSMWLCTVISKSVYASKLPIVSTESTERKYVEHIVEVDGIVVAGDKSPVTALSGLRVEQLLVQEGDQVEEGDVLFTVDMQDLETIMAQKQTSISKLQTQINTIAQNEELARQIKEREEQRAREDYDEQAQREDTLVGRAAEEYRKIEEEIDDQRFAERRRVEQERAQALEAGEEWSDENMEDIPEGDVDEALLEALQQAAYAEADAKWQRDNAIKNAGRKVEDITTPDNEDATLEVSQMELSELQTELARYQAIKDAEGQIKAGKGGLITDVYISVGGRTSDSAVMLLANDDVPCQFKTVLTQEQKKYVGLNDEVSLKLDGSSKEKNVSVDYLAESSTSPGNYEVYIDLPEGTGVPGLSGTMSRAESGEKFSCCVTPGAIYKVPPRAYVYVVKERDGILGSEYYAEQVNVRVLDENENWVAVEGALDDDSIIISSSTKEIKNGDVVRLSEQ